MKASVKDNLINEERLSQIIDAIANPIHQQINEILIKLSVPEIRALIKWENGRVLRHASQSGNEEATELLLKATTGSSDKLAMLNANDYGTFRLAAQNGHIEVIKILLKA